MLLSDKKCIIDSKNGQKIECSVVLEENKLNVVPKKNLCL